MADAQRQIEIVQRAEVARGRSSLLRSELRASTARLRWELERLRFFGDALAARRRRARR